MKTKVLFCLAVIFLMASSGVAYAHSDGINIVYNGIPVSDARAFIDENNRIQVCVETIEQLLKVEYINMTPPTGFPQSAEHMEFGFRKDGKLVLHMNVKQNSLYMAENETGAVLMDTTPAWKDGLLYVPVRYVAEALGYRVEWNGKKNCVGIYGNAEEMSVEQLIAVSENGDKYPIGFVDNAILQYEPDRIIGSADTTESARGVIEKYFESSENNVLAECKLLLEEDWYYLYKVDWVFTDRSSEKTNYDVNMIVLNSEYYSSKYGTLTGHLCHVSDKRMICDILNLTYSTKFSNSAGVNVLYSSIAENAETYTYTIYCVQRVGGDWGINDYLIFQKYTVLIDKKSGAVTYPNYGNAERIGDEIDIEGTAPQQPGTIN